MASENGMEKIYDINKNRPISTPTFAQICKQNVKE